MALITNDAVKIERATGFDAWYYSLPAHLSLDGWRSELPVGVFNGSERPLVLLKEIDRTNVEALPPNRTRFIFHTPYFTFDRYRSPSNARPDLFSALQQVTASEDRLDDTLPAALHDRLQTQLGLSPAADILSAGPGYHYEIPLAAVSASFGPGRDHIKGVAEARFRKLGVAAELQRYLDRDDHGFDLLFQLMKEQGIEVLVASSPLSVQELTGFPMDLLREGVWAVLERDSGIVNVVARRELPWFAPAMTKAQSDFYSGVGHLGRIGYEDLDLTESGRNSLSIDLKASVPATNLLRRWRELMSWKDVGFYAIASDVTLRGIEAALALVQSRVAVGDAVTEVDAYARYAAVVASIIKDEKLPFSVRTYFTHTHAGNRSLLPAKATRHSLDPLTSLKIDAGLLLYDERHLYRAVSDVTRSFVVSSEAKDFYRLLEDALIDAAIPSCCAGRTGQEVFRLGMGHLEPHRQQIVDWGFAPETGESLTDSFRRDIGHLLGKQEPATVGLRIGNKELLGPGMVGAAEFQWPYRDHCIGVEDLFIVTEDGPINLTRGRGH